MFQLHEMAEILHAYTFMADG